jgi:hypothetical protein
MHRGCQCISQLSTIVLLVVSVRDTDLIGSSVAGGCCCEIVESSRTVSEDVGCAHLYSSSCIMRASTLLALSTLLVATQSFICPASFTPRNAIAATQRPARRHARTVVMMGRRAEKIARTKDKADAKRTKIFARIGKKIIMVSG